MAELRRYWWLAAIALLVILGTAAANWRYETSVDHNLGALKGGLCKIVGHSNKLGEQNKAALLATAHRAEIRSRLDTQAGRTDLAQADRDTAALYRRFAREITPTRLEGCP